jgi:hypothetical protein
VKRLKIKILIVLPNNLSEKVIIIIIKLFDEEPESVGNSIKDEIVSKGGFDYEFNE